MFGYSTSMVIRRIRANEGVRLREIRLRALAEAPHAFGDTLAAAAARPESVYQQRAENGAAGEKSVLFIAEESGHWFGLAGGIVDEDGSGEPELVSMWVAPVARHHGVAQQLVSAVLTWARDRGADHLRLWVTEGNTPAIALYERFGFGFTGKSAPLPSNPALGEVEMVCPLPSP